MFENEDHWKVFDTDKHVDEFLKSKNEFSIPALGTSHEENYLYNEEILGT